MFLKTITLNWKSIERSVENAQIFRKKCNIQNSTVKKEIQKEIRKYFKLNGNKTYHIKICVLPLE